jgi:ABC-2 type transport system permease protein
MASLGLDSMLSTLGFLAMIGTMGGVAVTLQVAWRVGAARAEEESGRLDLVLTRPVSRWRWLGGHAGLALLGGVLLVVVSGSALWAGAALSGSDDITWAACAKASLNALPVVALFGGLAVAAFGLLPRLTVVLPTALVVVAYLLTLLGPALQWPSWVLDLSPFTHLALVPAEPWAAPSACVMTALGLLLTALGLAAFRHRDLVSS